MFVPVAFNCKGPVPCFRNPFAKHKDEITDKKNTEMYIIYKMYINEVFLNILNTEEVHFPKNYWKLWFQYEDNDDINNTPLIVGKYFNVPSQRQI